MNDLTFENTDKVFPAIQYNDGWVWVDKEATITEGKYRLNKAGFIVIHGIDMSAKDSSLVIAQSPSLNLEGVPVVEVYDQLNKLASNKACEIFGNAFSMASLGYQQVFKEGYKAAQSKGCYAEDDMLRLAIHCWNVASRPEQRKVYHINDIVKDYLQSIQPEIVVETITHPDSSTMSGHYEPITYQKNGRTYFKLKQ